MLAGTRAKLTTKIDLKNILCPHRHIPGGRIWEITVGERFEPTTYNDSHTKKNLTSNRIRATDLLQEESRESSELDAQKNSDTIGSC
jgi:hypothetical protein